MRLWKYELLVFVSGLTTAMSLLFVLMMIRNIETGFESTLDVYQTLTIASIVFVVSLPILPIILLRYPTLYNDPPKTLTKILYATGTRVKKRCTICHKHPVSKGYHLKHVHQLKNVKKGDYFEDCGCEMCQNLGGWMEDIYHNFKKDR